MKHAAARSALVAGVLVAAGLTACSAPQDTTGQAAASADPSPTSAATVAAAPETSRAAATPSPTPPPTPTPQAEGPYVVPTGWVDVSDATPTAVSMYDADPSNGAMVILTVEQNPAARADMSTELGALFDPDASYDDLAVTLPALTTRDGSTTSQGLTYTQTTGDGTTLSGAMYLLDGWIIEVAGADGTAPAQDIITREALDGDIRVIVTSLDLDQLS